MYAELMRNHKKYRIKSLYGNKLDSLSFGVLYLKDEFLAVRELADGEGKAVVLTYPDGMAVSFTGSVSTVLSGAEVNSVLTYNIEITPMSDIEITAGA